MAWINRSSQACVQARHPPSTLEGKQGPLRQGTRIPEGPGDSISSKSQTWLTGALRDFRGLHGQRNLAHGLRRAAVGGTGGGGGANLTRPGVQGARGLPGTRWPAIRVCRDRRGPVSRPGCLISHFTYSFTSWAFWGAKAPLCIHASSTHRTLGL